MRIGIITALAREAASFRAAQGMLCHDLDYVVTCAGPGPTRAAAAAADCTASGCDALMSWGVAGALVGELAPGALVLASAIHTEDGAELLCDRALNARLAASLAMLAPLHARLASVTEPVLEGTAKRALGAATGCVAVDLESAAIARTAAAVGAAFVAVRCVVDPVAFDLPAAALAGLRADGSVAPAATLTALLRQPSDLPDLLRLATWFRRATSTLARAARALGA